MLDNHINGLAIVDEDENIGILSKTDIV